MALTFSCTCGKRLKAADALAGKVTRCPQCGNRLTVPAVTEPEQLFEIAEDDETPRGDGIELPWLKVDDAPLLPSRRSAAVVAPPSRAEPQAPIVALIAAPADEQVETEAPADLEALIQPEAEPIRPSHDRPHKSDGVPFVASSLGEPWFVAWVEWPARLNILVAIVCLALVPSLFLVGGLSALARTGDPRAMFELLWMGLPVFAVLLTGASIIVVAALIWAAPFLLLVDLWRRNRAMSARLDALLRRAERSPADRAADASGQ